MTKAAQYKRNSTPNSTIPDVITAKVVIGNINQSTDEDFNCAICYFNTRLATKSKKGKWNGFELLVLVKRLHF